VCNHQCLHCYNYWRNDPRQVSLPKNYKQLYQTVVDELIKSKVFHVVITGGEPLVVIEKIAEFIKQLHLAGITLSINTNLTLLTPQRAVLLKEIGIQSVLVSLPSANAQTCDFIVKKKNSLSRIIKGIKIAVGSGLGVSANMVVSQYNLPDIEKTAELARSLGISNLSVTRASNPIPGSWFAEKVLTKDQFLEMQSLIDSLKEKYGYSFESLEAISLCSYDQEHVSKAVRSCSAGKSAMAISFEGTLKACIRLDQSYGNITGGLTVGWKSMDGNRSNIWLPLECQPCKLKHRCGGGCRADALVATGAINGLDGFCNPAKVPTVEKQPIRLTESNTFSVNEKIRFREESFGKIILLSTSNWVPVTNELFGLLKNMKLISLETIVRTFDTDEEEATKIASRLVQMKFLTPQQKGGKPCQKQYCL
jgi:radical SAM protein with 4Fe4S-binding SPASM domain